MVNPASIPFSAVLVVMLVSAITASAAPAPSPAPPMIGMPDCDTRCGNIRVRYPFGMGSSHCYHSPGFNLTCDRRTDPPRLLLGDGTLQVVQDISEYFTSVTVTRTSGGGDIEIDADGNGAFGGGISGPNSPYSLSEGLGMSFDNELILTGCNVQATLKNAVDNTTISSCSSLCTDDPFEIMKMVSSFSCRSPVVNSKAGSAYHLHLDWFGANSSHDKRWPWRVLVASTGWFEQKLISDRWLLIDHPSKDAMAAPSVMLKWEVPFEHGDNMSSPTSPSASGYRKCSEDEARNVCKSKHSNCIKFSGSRECDCKAGYTGNPYLTDGCRDIDECRPQNDEDIECHGNCTNTDGSFECHCPAGTRGNPSLPGGCISYSDLPASGTPCNRSCGDVAVPYPFGMGSPRCYSPGFNLTCDYHTSGHEHPRLLLDDYGHLRVINISLENTTVLVVRTGPLIAVTDSFFFDDFFTGLDQSESARREKLPYALSTRNELILIGCNVQAMLVGAGSDLWEGPRTYLSGCSSLCSLDGNSSYAAASSNGDMNCYGVDCCQARISMSKDGFPEAISLDWIDENSAKKLPIYAFVAEEGWFDRRKVIWISGPGTLGQPLI